MSEALESYALEPSYGRLTGVAVACHAISDAYLIMHAGVGCKDKATHLLAHDWQRHCNLRQGWTEVGDRSLISGSVDRIGPYVRSWQGRMGAGVICVTPASFLEMAGEDLAGAVREAEKDAGVPVLLVRAPGHDGDEFDGYAAVCAAVLDRIEWQSKAPPADQVALLGNWFDRYEGDHLGNLTQLRTMLKALGLHLGSVLLSGCSYQDGLVAGRAGTVVELPYLQPAHRQLDRLWKSCGRRPVATDLPMGFAGTRRWLETVGRAAGIDSRLVAAYADKRAAKARHPLTKMKSRWRSTRVAVLADPPLAVGYCSMLLELGLRPVLVGLRGGSLGGRDAFEAVLERNGLGLPSGAEILESPSLARIRDELRDRLRAGELDGVLGSATELNVLTRLPAEELIPAHDPRAAARRGPFVLEIGFPCWHFHAVQQMPFMGYAGLVTLAQRLVDPPRLHDAGRGAIW